MAVFCMRMIVGIYSPAQNAEYWQKKRARNIARDVEVSEHLEKLGRTVIRIWECELKKKNQTFFFEAR